MTYTVSQLDDLCYRTARNADRRAIRISWELQIRPKVNDQGVYVTIETVLIITYRAGGKTQGAEHIL